MKKITFGALVGAVGMLLAVLLAQTFPSIDARKPSTLAFLISLRVVVPDIQRELALSGKVTDVEGKMAKFMSGVKNHVPELFIIRDDGLMVARLGQEGKVLVLIPTVKDGAVSWRCIGGPTVSMPSQCMEEVLDNVPWPN